ncbi:MAG TPA: CopG family transcriptional regulator [Phycisphaerae bacterium]|nr:CopG family transcriptional regulator [Phycisphaerae bacterium]
MPNGKQAIVSFKAEPSLVEALRGVHNRSAFIRAAVLSALENTCPLCSGAGILTPEQKAHWDAFAVDHTVTECGDCHEWHLTCALESDHGESHVHDAKSASDTERPS